jgi:hypothetical protein
MQKETLSSAKRTRSIPLEMLKKLIESNQSDIPSKINTSSEPVQSIHRAVNLACK